MSVVVVVYGPKAAGKSQVTAALRDLYGITPVDADEIVLDLLAAGVRPDARDGWLAPVEQAVRAALQQHAAVSVEATGAWDSDWQLAEHLEAAGVQVLRVWVSAPLEATLERLARRTARKAPTSVDEARAIYGAAVARARERHFDVRVDTGSLPLTDLPSALEPLERLGLRALHR